MTFAALPIRFDQPGWLLLLVLIVPVWLLGRQARRSFGGLSRFKAVATLTLRSILIAILAIALARPVWERTGEGLTVSILLDRSLSIPRQTKNEAVEFLRQAVERKERREDRVAVISLGKNAQIESLPDSYTAVTSPPDEGDLTATNLAAGVRLALAIMPDDTSNRILLASDGNETVDSVLAAAEIARANRVPIDVLLLEYEHQREIIFDEIVAPARAREGQAAEIKLVLRSQAPASGRLRLMVNGTYLDLNGEDEAGDALAVTLEAGANAFAQTLTLDQSRPHVFEAVFLPDDPEMDSVEENNTAMAVTFVSGQGSVLIVDDGPTQSRYLADGLVESGITVETIRPDALIGGPVMLSAYDAIVLVNIPRWAIDEDTDRALHAYVHDLGGGLVMVGGPESFGAGGWIDSELAKALPIELTPPQTRQMPAGALALIMHSCEMAQGNFWGLKVAEAAIGALSRLDYVGIIEFSWQGVSTYQGCAWAFPMQRLGDKGAALAAAKSMQMGDMPSFEPSMLLALDKGFLAVNAAQRHAIIISDGDPSPPSQSTIQKYIDNRVTVTTVMVGGHGTVIDKSNMERVAEETGGTFYNVTNPKTLPEIFIKEAQIVSRSLIQDGDLYQPSVVTQLPGPTQGYETVPPIDGYVLTAPRDGLAMAPIVIGTEDGNDPLFAHWNYGLGRAIAYTSDLSERWGSHWAGWSQFQAFWEQAIRWVMRPASPTNVHVSTRIEGERAIVEAEALDADASFLNLLRPSAVVLRPDATAETTSLQQVGPGRYRMEFPVSEAGSYLVNIACRTGEGDPLMLPAAVTVPYPREFRTVKHNAALLSDLAEMTGGRMLEGGDPRLVDLFDDSALETPRSPRPVWDLLAIVAACLLLIDVAARRLSIEGRAIAAWASRAVGRRAAVGEETVEAWKRARSQVAHRGVKGKRGAAVATSDVALDARSVRFEAGEGDESVAIDVSEETAPGEARKKPDRAKPAKAAPAAAGADDGDYTSRLLAAKRRARGDEGEGEGGGGGGAGGGGAGGGSGGASGGTT